jgi:uncharacterized phage protein (TIGR01671 family)
MIDMENYIKDLNGLNKSQFKKSQKEVKSMENVKFRVRNLEKNRFENLEDIIITYDNSGLEIYTKDGSVLDNYELNQYTGLIDKNGTEICRGDIVQFYNDAEYIMTPGYALVDFDFGAFILKHKKYVSDYLGEFDIDEQIIKVVGNIYDNSDLLSL